MAGPATNPPSFTMSVTEVLGLPFDATAYLSAGQTVTSVTSTMVNLAGGQTVTLNDAPSVSGNIVTQILNGPAELVAPGTYRLTVSFVASPSSNKWAMQLVVYVVP